MAKSAKPVKTAKKPRAPKKGPEDFPTSHAQSILHALGRIKLTEHQSDCIKLIEENKINFVQGPAGTAKTFVTCYVALKMLAENTIRKIILSKPVAVVKNQEIGFLPGSVDEKIALMMSSYKGNLQRILGEALLTQLEMEKLIEYHPLTYLRGNNFNKVAICLDEAQNTDYSSLIMFITRFGKGSKMMISGDVSQYDINKRDVTMPILADLFKEVNGVGNYAFTKEDIVRESILIEITEIYEKWKAINNL